MNRKDCKCEVNEDLNQDTEKKKSLFYSYLNQPYKKTHRDREKERVLSIKSLHKLSLKAPSVSFMISGPPASICSDQDLIPFPYFTFSTKVSFLPSPQKNSDFLSFCSNSLSPEMVHAFKGWGWF